MPLFTWREGGFLRTLSAGKVGSCSPCDIKQIGARLAPDISPDRCSWVYLALWSTWGARVEDRMRGGND